MNIQKTQVVVVDDNEAYCSALAFLFEGISNIEFKFYYDAAVFLENYTQDWRGFLLMDLFMPCMDGIALLEQLKQRHNKMYTIVISGHADKATAEKVKSLGADEFLTKPFDVNYLLKKILHSSR